MWRFLPFENVERFISRDADSRLSIREKLAVDKWIESDKTLHIMRDHPHHNVYIFAGLFGLVVTEDLNLKNNILEFTIYDTYLFNKWSDTPFLNKYVYNKYLLNDDIYVMIHVSLNIHFQIHFQQKWWIIGLLVKFMTKMIIDIINIKNG